VGCESLTGEAEQDEDEPGGTDGPGGEVDPQLDTDGDGVPDVIERQWGSNPASVDSDGDGLTDIDEVATLTDPSVADSDGNGVADGDEDLDGDGLSNLAENGLGTNLARPDTDGDGLDDGSEAARGSDPLTSDTDGDGLSDAQEAELGTNLLNVDSNGNGVRDGREKYTRTLTAPASGATLVLEDVGESIFNIELLDATEVWLSTMPGAVSTGVNVEGVSSLTRATGTLEIPFDPTTIEPGANLGVLHFDALGRWDFPPVQSVDISRGVATVTTSSFSPFVVVDRDKFEASWQVELVEPVIPRDRNPVDVMIIVDSSARMRSADPDFTRVDIARELILNLEEGDRVGLSGTTRGMLQVPDANHLLAYGAAGNIYSAYESNLSGRIEEALHALDTYGAEGHERAIVLISNGLGQYDSNVIHQVMESGTTMYTIGVGNGNADRLRVMATVTNGIHVPWGVAGGTNAVGADLGVVANRPLDSDGDGLTDEFELGGFRTYWGEVLYTDPYDADTDGDGLEDGSEVKDPYPYGYAQEAKVYRLMSDPTKRDTDGDGLADAVEVANLIDAFNAYSDPDGINDYEEWVLYNTDPIAQDTDGDGFGDDFEVWYEDQGFDPTLPDVSYSWWEYLGEFTRGALCGDITLGSFCEGTTVAFLSGQIAAGFAIVGDVRDGLASAVKGDVVGASLSAFGVIPIVGDSAKLTAQIARFATRVGGDSAVALRFIGRSSSIPSPVRIAALDEAFEGAATAVKTRHGLDDDAILAYARRGMSPSHLEKMFSKASVVRWGKGTYQKEIDAEGELLLEVPGSDVNKFAVTNPVGDVRIFDVTFETKGFAYEVKFGKVHYSGRARTQAMRDGNFLAEVADDSSFHSIEWVFYADQRGVAGPDEDLLKLLIDLKIPYRIYLP